MENDAKGGFAGSGDPRRADAKGEKGIHAQRTGHSLPDPPPDVQNGMQNGQHDRGNAAPGRAGGAFALSVGWGALTLANERKGKQGSCGGGFNYARIRVMHPPRLPVRLQTLLAAIGTSEKGHAVVCRRGIPLLLLPGDERMALATAELYRPQSRKARVAATGVRFLCRLGWHGRLLPSVPGNSDATGILVCNPAHGTRVVAVRRTPDNRLEIVKAALDEDAAALRREQETLCQLRGHPGVPNVGPLEERNDAVWFSMPYLREAKQDIDSIHLLQAWRSEEREPAPNNGLIRDLFPFLDERTRASLAGRSVRRALVHGDFAPWNWRTDGNGRLVCIDWEWAREDGFAGFDLVYCLVQQALLVKRVSEKRLLPFAERAVSRLSPEGKACIQEAGLPLDLLVSLVLAYRQSKRMDPLPGGADNVGAPLHSPPPVRRRTPSHRRRAFYAIEGADGVGKSTVLRLLVPELVQRGGFNGYLFFHWKPVKSNLSYDAIPRDNPHDPRGKAPRNPLASLVFLAHHWLDFQLGYWRFIRPAIRNGWLVIADRYTYDVLLDPKRFRLKLPAWILRLFVRTIPRPDRSILLHAEPAVIRARKPELTEEEIAHYQTALMNCPAIRNSVSVDAGKPPDAIVAETLDCIVPIERI